MPGKRKRQAYDNAFKIRVIEFAENLNNNSAAEGEFGISEKLVRDWRKNKDTIVSGPMLCLSILKNIIFHFHNKSY